MTINDKSTSRDSAEHVYAPPRYDALPDLEPQEAFHDEIEGGLRLVSLICLGAAVTFVGVAVLAFGGVW